ncbi:MAG: hypothetical protein WC250_01275 [Candidatus Paceibacterota bacterium]|jgi:hypothetical protein
MRATATLVIFIIALCLLILPGELSLHLFGPQLREFVAGSKAWAIVVAIGMAITGVLFLLLVGKICQHFFFPYLKVKDEDLPDLLNDDENE